MKNYSIAVIEGDGMGREVVPKGFRVLEAFGRKYDISFRGDILTELRTVGKEKRRLSTPL